jgi:alkaline phosphatase D
MSAPTFRSAAVSRRAVLAGAAGLLAAPGINLVVPARAQFKSEVFTLGVASGDPAPDGFVIWTRLAPEPLAISGGMPAIPVEVSWEVAADPTLGEVLRSGSAIARPELAHAVHVEVDGLAPGRDYFYRFRSGGVESATGRVRTLPAPGSEPAQLRFAAAGCQQWEGGFYTAWRGIAADELDFVFHYGDYIYENAYTESDRYGRSVARIMPRDFGVCYTLTDYRRRYALYKGDADLQAAHASCAFLPSFDDHEVANNWTGSGIHGGAQDALLVRRAAAFQAWYEHMPVRRSQMPRGPDVLAYRRLAFGRLADVAVLDTRQYRSLQPCGDGFKAGCTEAAAADRTMMGAQQERWLADGLRGARATWQVFAQQVLFAPLDWRAVPWVAPAEAPVGDLDAWDGAVAARQRMLALWQEAKVANPVVLSGDVHRGLALELGADPRDPQSRCLGVEFLATSISSGGDGSAAVTNAARLYADNPHLKFASDQRGYHRHTVTAREWRADFRTVAKISAAQAPLTTARTLVVEAGRPGLTLP